MTKKIKRVVMTMAALVALLVPVAAPVMVAAQVNIEDNLCNGAQLNATAAANCDTATDEAAGTRVNSLLTSVINIFSLVVGVISVIMIIIGGLKYITSAGDSGNVTSAKNTILYAIVGLVIVALAQFIVRFVLSRVAAPVE